MNPTYSFKGPQLLATEGRVPKFLENGTAHAVTNKATGGGATEFMNPAGVRLVVVADATKQLANDPATRMRDKKAEVFYPRK